jgi:NADH dehydrogenase FAD-containing subunit
VDKYLEIPQFKGVYALGDCAYITDSYRKTMPSYNAARYKRRCSGRKNIIAAVEDRRRMDDTETFDYKTKGMMASIGK